MINFVPFGLLAFAFTFDLFQSLQHEKSFYVQEELKGIDKIDFYAGSILINTDNDVIQRDLVTGAVQRTFRAHKNIVSGLTVVNGSVMITIGFDLQLILWDLVSGSITKRIGLGSEATTPLCIAVADNMAYIGTRNYKVLKVDLITGRTLRIRDLGNAVLTLSLSSEHLYAGGQFFPLAQKLDLNTLETVQNFNGHDNTISQLTYYRGVLYTCSADTRMLAFDVETGSVLKTFIGNTVWITSVMANDSNLYSGNSFGHLIHWDIDTAEIINQFPAYHGGQINNLVLYDGSLFSSSFNVVARWNILSYTLEFSYRGRVSSMNAVVVWKNYAVGAGSAGIISFWDSEAKTFEPTYSLSGQTGGISEMYILDDILYTADFNRIRKWDLGQFVIEKSISVPTSSVTSLFAREESVFAGTFDGNFRKWNSSSGDLIHEFKLHTETVSDIEYYTDVLLTSSFDFSIAWWNPRDYSLIMKQPAPSFQLNRIFIAEDVVYACGFELMSFDFTSGERFNILNIIDYCYDLTGQPTFLILASADTTIQLRNPQTFEVFTSLKNSQASALCLDANNILYSAGTDGAIKKWNLDSRSIAFSFEDLSDAVTSLASNSVGLLVGLRRGVLQKYDTESAVYVEGKKLYDGKIVSIAQEDDSILTFGQKGICSSHSLNGLDLEYVCYNDTSAPLISVAFHANIVFLLRGENEIIALNSSGLYPPLWKIQSTFALTCLAATESQIFAGTKSGRIFGWDNADQQASFEVTKQTASINFLLADEDVLYSASDDNTIVQWSIGSSEVLNTLQRSSATALGHLGPVNSLSLCNNVLFSAGSDLTVRRWNVFNGKHEDLYFGHMKKVNVVLCHNGSVFSGGDDFAVLLYKPTLPQAIVKKTTTLIGAATSKAQRNIKRVTARVDSAYSLPVSLIIIPSFAAGVVIIILLALACWLRRKDLNATTSPLDSMAKSGVTDSEATNTNTMLRTLVPTTMGLSMHAQLEINPVYISRGSLLAKGGGGYLYKANLMGQDLIALHGENVVQKLVTVSGRSARESFDQEVAIMAMLSTFPHFCKLVGYTLNPLSMILKYYPSGSLDAWITRHTYGKRVAFQLVYEISKAVSIMHSHFLAHCDLKTQNVLVESKDGDIHAYLTDFGITQVLSEKILAAKLFSVINLRGLSVRYASPEAFRAFKTKDYTKSDFKMYDIYSLACVMVELLTRKLPWS